MKRNCVVLDVDGTLIDYNGSPLCDLETLGRYLRSGESRIILATGRGYDDLKILSPIIESLGVHALVLDCGAEVADVRDGAVFPSDLYRRHVLSKGPGVEAVYCRELVKGMVGVKPQSSLVIETAIRQKFYVENSSANVFQFRKIRAAIGNAEMLLSADYADRSRLFLDVQPKWMGKQCGVDFLLNLWGLSKDRVAFFGDNGNDIPCFFKYRNAFLVPTLRDFLFEAYPDCPWHVVNSLNNFGSMSIHSALVGVL